MARVFRNKDGDVITNVTGTSRIFRLENGERLEIAGRDPSKRYAHKGGVHGEYWLELTSEQESARDAEEAAWEAGRAAREAKATREVQRETRLAELNALPTLTRAERDEWQDLMRERERVVR